MAGIGEAVRREPVRPRSMRRKAAGTRSVSCRVVRISPENLRKRSGADRRRAEKQRSGGVTCALIRCCREP